MIYNIISFVLLFVNGSTFRAWKLRKPLYFALLVFLFFFVAFRWQVGCDWESYLKHADMAINLSYSDAMQESERGYWVTIVALDRLGFQYPTINILSALSFFVGVHLIARRQPDPLMYLSLLFPILIVGVPMATTRQALALGFVCGAYVAFENKKPYLFCILLLIASQFHASAIAFIVLAPLLFAKTPKTRLLSILFLSGPIIFYLSQSETVKSYTENYTSGNYEAAGAPARAALVTASGALFFLMLKRAWAKFSPHDEEVVFYISLMMIPMFPLVFYSSVIADRFGYYLMPMAYVIQSRAYLLLPNKNTQILAFYVPFLIGVANLFVWTQYSSLFALCYQYKIWWDVSY